VSKVTRGKRGPYKGQGPPPLQERQQKINPSRKQDDESGKRKKGNQGEKRKGPFHLSAPLAASWRMGRGQGGRGEGGFTCHPKRLGTQQKKKKSWGKCYFAGVTRQPEFGQKAGIKTEQKEGAQPKKDACKNIEEKGRQRDPPESGRGKGKNPGGTRISEKRNGRGPSGTKQKIFASKASCRKTGRTVDEDRPTKNGTPNPHSVLLGAQLGEGDAKGGGSSKGADEKKRGSNFLPKGQRQSSV